MSRCPHENARLLYSVNGYSIIECTLCGLRKTRSIPSYEELQKIYNQEFYSSKDSRRFGSLGEALVRFFRFLRASGIARAYAPKRILDVGCGRGLMLYFLKKYFGATYVAGTQYSDSAIKYAKERLGIEVKKGDLKDIFPSLEKDLDLICFWHVLEHIDDVDTYLDLSCKLLRTGGNLLIEVPNSDSFSRRLTGSSWLGWDPPNHLTHFTPESLTLLLEKHGFRIIKRSYFSFEYSIFTTVQSFLNKISGRRNLLFNSLLTGKKEKTPASSLAGHLLIALLITPLAIVTNLILYKSKKGEVIHLVARK